MVRVKNCNVFIRAGKDLAPVFLSPFFPGFDAI